MDKCRSCRTTIMWLNHHETGKAAPVDAQPHPEGNLAIDRTKKIYRNLNLDEIINGRLDKKNLYINHFATCPNAKNFRSKTNKKEKSTNV